MKINKIIAVLTIVSLAITMAVTVMNLVKLKNA